MISYHTLTQALDANQSNDVGITYIEGEKNEHTVSLQQLYDRALGILHHFQSKGVAPGDELIFLLNNNEQFVDAFWACLYGRIIPVPVGVGISDEHRLKLFRVFGKLNKPYLYTSQSNLYRLEAFAKTNHLQTEFQRIKSKTIILDDIEDVSQPGQRHDPQPEDTAFIQFSSGSTSEPKGVVLTHKNLIANIQSIAQISGISHQDTYLSWMPLTHDMGIIGFHLAPLVVKGHQYLMPTELFIRRPLLWLLKASEKQITVLSSPNFGYKHYLKQFHSKQPQNLDLSRIRLIFNGAEPISVGLTQEFLQTMAPSGLKPNAMYPVYGLAEASLAVAFPQPGTSLNSLRLDRQQLSPGDQVRFCQDGVDFISVGRPLPGCQVRITDDQDTPLAEQQVGYIQIKGDNVTNGYYQNQGLDRSSFADNGWLNTGDLGFLHNGELAITGRAKDIIFIHGMNYYPHDLEAIIEKQVGLELGKVAACGLRPENAATDEILVFVLYRGAMEDFIPLLKDIRRSINEQAGVEVTQVIPVRRIPKTTSGKIQRYRLGEDYRQGEFADVLTQLEQRLAAANAQGSDAKTEIERTLKGICNAVINDRTVGVEDNIFEIGTSSLALAQIYERIEEIYPGQLEITDFFDYPTIVELASYLEAKTA